MPIPFTCPHCGIQTDVAEEYAGQTGPCAGCGSTITVPPLAGTPGYSAPRRGWQGPAAIILVVVLGIGVFLVCGGGLFLLSFRSAPAPPPGSMTAPATVSAQPAGTGCTNNLRRIGLALRNYHDAYGCFPPAYVADEDGQRMHSWRVLLLPYLDGQWLYSQYNFNEPWDSPENLALSEMMPDVFRCPEDFTAGPSDTSYVMILGPGTISDGTGTTTISDFGGVASDAIVVFEVAASGIKWLEPRDLGAEKISSRTNEAVRGTRSNHLGFVHALCADGSVTTISTITSPDSIKAMSKVPGSEDPAGGSRKD